MSNSKLQLTDENTNLARVAQMILGPCTNVLRDILRKEISQPDLEKKVRAYVSNSKKPPINKHQQRLVYGQDYSKFDITLLCFLLRNMCSIPPHSNKWGNNPSPVDRSVSANIERIRLIRNEYGHNSEGSISNADFNIQYQNIKVIVQELEKYLGCFIRYQEEVKKLETCPMDPTQSEKNIKELLDLYEKLRDISGDVKEMKNTVLPWNIKAIYENDVLKWKKDDTFFLETHNFQSMLDKVKKQPFVTFVGVPGSGKTATARHIALSLQDKSGYEILPTKDIKDIETYCDPNNPQVFVIDDVAGVFGFDMKELEKLTMYKDRLKKPTMSETKILMTCRELVFKHEAFSGSFLSHEKHVVQLHSEENALNDQDKYDLFAKYNLDKDLLSADTCTLSKISKSFPYLCKLFSRKEELKLYGPKFFISPVPCILELLDDMKLKNKVHYASLVFLMINQNALSEKNIKDEHTKYFNELKSQVLKRCKVDPTICSFHIIDALTEMVGTYTEHRQSEFKFIHDSMLEIVAYHFGRHFPEVMLQCMNSGYIAYYIKPDKYKCKKRKREEDKLEQTADAKVDSDTVDDKEKVHDLCITLHESFYNLLADRLFKDIKNGELFNVFQNKALKDPLVLQRFLNVMKSKHYSELSTVFLSTLKKKPVRSEKTVWSYELLINSRLICDYSIPYTCVRAIDWVIFYGHGHILQFIINQIITNTNTINDLFLTPFNTVENTVCYKRNELSINENSTPSDVSDNESWSDLMSDDESWSDLSSETNSLEEILATENVIVEQRRLLNLGCYSTDFLTVQTLLEHLDKDVLNFKSWEIDQLTDYYDWDIFNPPIVVASGIGHLNILRELLKHGADVNIMVEFDSPLRAACSNRHLDIVIELLKHGADVNITGKFDSPLSAACIDGYLDIVDELLKHVGDDNITSKLNFPLVGACFNGHINIVAELLKLGADVNNTNTGSSPLIDACSEGHFDIVVKLLKHGADVNKTSALKSPLIAACSNGHVNIVYELLKNGADVNIKVSDNSPLVAMCSISFSVHSRCLLRHCQNINTTDFDNLSAKAECSKIHLDMVRELLKYKANVNIKNLNTSPLIAVCSNKNINIATVQELLNHGADANLTVTKKSPLISACTEGRLDVVVELLKHGADVNNAASGISPLIAACLKGHLRIVSELLKNGANANPTLETYSPLIRFINYPHLDMINKDIKYNANDNKTFLNVSPLIAACSNGYLDIVIELVKHGADVNFTVSDNSPLLVACSKGHSKIVEELFKNGADANIAVSKDSPLIAACSKGFLDITNELLKHGANVNVIVSYNSPLLAACSKGHSEIVEELFKYRADANIAVSIDTPLIVACSKGYLDITSELLKHGANVNLMRFYESPLIVACSRRHSKIVEELFKYGADANIALIAACSKGCFDVINELIKHEADVNITDSNTSPLIAACSNGYLDIISLLLKHGADVNLTVSGNSPLTATCSKQFHLLNEAAYAKTIACDTLFRLSYSKVHLAIIRKLIKHKADVNAKNLKDSPLNAFCSEGYLDIVCELLNHGADANIVVNDHFPLITACANGSLDIVLELLKHGAHVNYRVFNNSPLIAACSCGRLGIVIELLKRGADVNITVSDNSPLIAACSKGHLDIVLELLKHGANVYMKVSDHSPLKAAHSRGHLGIVNELLKHGADVNNTGYCSLQGNELMLTPDITS